MFYYTYNKIYLNIFNIQYLFNIYLNIYFIYIYTERA